MTVNTVIRFWAKVAKLDSPDDCWIWTGATSPGGYGRFRMDGSKTGEAHRWSYELLVGPIPEGMQLEPVTHVENIRRGLHPGSGPQTKLTKDQVRMVRALLAMGETKKAVSQRFGVCTDTIYRIASGATWANVS